MRPRGFELDRTRFYGRVSPSGKYFVTWIVANYKKKMRNSRINKIENQCILTLRRFDKLTAVKRENHSIVPLNALLNLFIDDWFILLFAFDVVEIRSTETFKVIHNIQVGYLTDYANGYFISRPWKSADTVKYVNY